MTFLCGAQKYVQLQSGSFIYIEVLLQFYISVERTFPLSTANKSWSQITNRVLWGILVAEEKEPVRWMRMQTDSFLQEL